MVEGCDGGSVVSSVDGSVEGSVEGSVKGSVEGSVEGSVKGSVEGSDGELVDSVMIELAAVEVAGAMLVTSSAQLLLVGPAQECSQQHAHNLHRS